MVTNSELKRKNSEETRVIFYDETGTSTGFLFTNQSLYDLYDKLREFYNKESEKNE